MSVGKARAYPKVESLKGASHVYAFALPANIRLGSKGLTGANTLAYCKNSQILEGKVL
jgi:hypothetical protein